MSKFGQRSLTTGRGHSPGFVKILALSRTLTIPTVSCVYAATTRKQPQWQYYRVTGLAPKMAPI